MAKNKSKLEAKLMKIEGMVQKITESMERSHFYEYVEYTANTKRFFIRSFLIGLSKGLGAAIGFSLLGALAIYLLQSIAESNMPYIADFISRLIDIIEK